MFRISFLLVIFLLGWHPFYGAGFRTDSGGNPRVRCEQPDAIPNGSYRIRRNSMLMRVSCNVGFQLQGYRIISCVRGKWAEDKPVCAKKGCNGTSTLTTPASGIIHVENDLKGTLFCEDGYSLAGNRVTYCNSTHWDRPLGTCRLRKNAIEHACDFETDDICGWVHQPRNGLEWKRVMAANVFTSFRTGPRHDHTTLSANGGHYMLMESLTRLSIPVTLTSPIYNRELSSKRTCCFQFYYFMYGAGVGTLYVLVKPVSLEVNDILANRTEFIKFQKNGNQNNLWNEAHFNIEEQEEDFQLVFVARGGLGHLSDIAIDDVRLLTGKDCQQFNSKNMDEEEKVTEENPETNTEENIFDTQSCVGRCNDHKEGKGVLLLLGHLIGLCSCMPSCEEMETCCPDFKTVCVNELFTEFTDTEPEASATIVADETWQTTNSSKKSTSQRVQPYNTQTFFNATNVASTDSSYIGSLPNPEMADIDVQTIPTTIHLSNTTAISLSTTTATSEEKANTTPLYDSAIELSTTKLTKTWAKIPSTSSRIDGVTKTTPITTANHSKLLITSAVTTPQSVAPETTISWQLAPERVYNTSITSIFAATTNNTTTTTAIPATVKLITTTISTSTKTRSPITIAAHTTMKAAPSTTTKATLATTSVLISNTGAFTVPTLATSTKIVTFDNNVTISETSRGRKTTQFVVAPLNTSDPNVVMMAKNHHTNGTRVLAIVLLLMFALILTLVGYRRCGSRAAAWYLIRFSKRRHTGDEEEEASYLTTNLDETDFYANFQTQTIINGTGTRSAGIRESDSNGGSKSKTEQTYIQAKAKLWKSSLASTLSKSKTSSSNEMKTPLWSSEGNDDEDQDEEDDQQNIKGKWTMVTSVNRANNNDNNSTKTFTEL